MPHVSIDEDPLHDRLVFGYDGTDYRVVKVDASGNLVAALNPGSTIEVTQATPANLQATVTPAAGATFEAVQDTAADLKATANLAADQNIQARGYGWIGAAWQKNPLQYGVSGQVVGAYQNLSAAAGANSLAGGDVPAGEVWLLRWAGILNENTASTLGALRLSAGGATLILSEKSPMVADRWSGWVGDILMVEGDNLIGYFEGCILNDNIYLRYLAVRIDIDQ